MPCPEAIELGYVDLEARTLQALDNRFGTRLLPMRQVQTLTHVLSTFGREAGILLDVHSVPRSEVGVLQLQLLRSGPNGQPPESSHLGRVLQALASAGLSDRGMILVGPAAFQTYSCTLGSFLPSSAIMTNDVDLLVASFDAPDEMLDLEKILQTADPTFKAEMSNTDK